MIKFADDILTIADNNIIDSAAYCLFKGSTVAVGEDVGNVTPAFETKLSLVIIIKDIACVSKEDRYGERTETFGGKR